MNKKGFTLLEVIISVILVSILLTSMLETLVKIREAYSIVYENTDALIFSSSLSRIINNDLQENGGIRYINCNYNGDVCDITLNNDQKRRVEIYNIYTGNLVGSDSDSQNKVPYYISSSGVQNWVDTSHKIFCEKVDHGGEMKVIADCEKATDDSTSNVMCICEKEIIATTLKYSDFTDPSNEKNIYLKTLNAEKYSEIKEIATNKYEATGQSQISGYNFGRMTFTNMVYDSSNKTTAAGTPYKNSISTLTIEINDGVDTQNPIYNVNLTSTSSYSPDKVQMGKELVFKFDNTNACTSSKITHKIKEFHIKFGVGFSIMTTENKLKEVQKLSNEGGLFEMPVIEGGSYIFDGYYYDLGGTNEMKVIDAEGNIIITSTFFDSDTDASGQIYLKARWKAADGSGYCGETPENSNKCDVGDTYHDCLLVKNKEDSLWQVELKNYTPSPPEYRFVGTKNTPPNNYICFGTTSNSDCTDSEKSKKYMYRIIGIFKEGENEYLKLIRNSPYGGFVVMDDHYNTDNVWSETTLYKSLNGNSSGDFLKSIKSPWKEKIVKRKWVSVDTGLNGYNSSGIKLWDLIPSKVYCLEYNIASCKPSGGTYSESEAKIGLMYTSDYILAMGEEIAKSNSKVMSLSAADGGTKRITKGWMNIYNSESEYKNKEIEWTMTRGGDHVNGLTNARFYKITNTGYPYATENRYGSQYRPVFYISASEIYAGGAGTATNPYIIKTD